VSLGLGALMALSKSEKRFGGITERTDPFRGGISPNASEVRLNHSLEWVC
jgi:hypothetical protein